MSDFDLDLFLFEDAFFDYLSMSSSTKVECRHSWPPYTCC